MKCTPTPWKRIDRSIFPDEPTLGKIADVFDYVDGTENAVENADFIIKAVNAYESQREMIRELVHALRNARQNLASEGDKWVDGELIQKVEDQIDAAISKAEKLL